MAKLSEISPNEVRSCFFLRIQILPTFWPEWILILIPRGHFLKAVIIMRDIMRGDYARDYARYYARLNLTVTTDVCSIGWLSRAMMCVDKGGVVGQA